MAFFNIVKISSLFVLVLVNTPDKTQSKLLELKIVLPKGSKCGEFVTKLPADFLSQMNMTFKDDCIPSNYSLLCQSEDFITCRAFIIGNNTNCTKVTTALQRMMLTASYVVYFIEPGPCRSIKSVNDTFCGSSHVQPQANQAHNGTVIAVAVLGVLLILLLSAVLAIQIYQVFIVRRGRRRNNTTSRKQQESVKAAPSTIRVPSFNKADNKQPTVTTVRVPSFNKAPDKKPKGIPTNKLPSSNLSEQEVYVESDQNDYTPQGYTYVVKESQQNEDDGDEEIYTDMD